MLLAHKVELRPTPEQATWLLKCIGARRYTYNALLEHFRKDGAKWSKKAACEHFMREVRQPWMAEVTSRAPRNAIDDLDTAFKSFFRRVKEGRAPFGFPRFHRRGQHDSFALREKPKFGVDGRRLRLEKAPGRILMRQALRFTGTLHSVTVSFRAGRFFAAVLVDTEDYDIRSGTREPSVVGVDLGLKDFAVLSGAGGHLHVPAGRKLKASLRRLRRLQRSLSRKEKGSNRRRIAREKVARLHLRVADQRQAMLHETSDMLTRRFDTIVVEDLAVRNMSRNRRLSQAVMDSSWAEFRRQLEYKAELRGNTLIVAPRFLPSSKTCSRCGAVKSALGLDERTCRCEACGHEQDRDENAADNLERHGLHTLPAVPKRASETGETDEALPRRTVAKDRREEACA